MKKVTSWYPLLGVGAIVLTGLAGCQDKNDNNQPDSLATTEQVDKAVENAGETVTDAAKDAGKAVEGAADAAVNTPKIKAALADNASLKGTTIDVDTDGTKNQIVLRGTVKNAAQKKAAETIAKREAPNYNIVNQLKVAGGGSKGK
ncbi:MAG TPA: BON domain-containing protein [Abditibacteriaceae bacterium]|nr:BON domain-containing protein [Abditibacteriaceae bacterium]